VGSSRQLLRTLAIAGDRVPPDIERLDRTEPGGWLASHSARLLCRRVPWWYRRAGLRNQPSVRRGLNFEATSTAACNLDVSTESEVSAFHASPFAARLVGSR